jgi:hypothetical protein
MSYLRNTETIRTDDRQWTDMAIQALLEGDDLVVVEAHTGKCVESSMRPRGG